MRSFGVIVALLLFVSAAQADPSGSRTGLQPNSSGTIVVTNTFQAVFAGSANRYACNVQNNSTHTMFVFFGPIASAMTTASLQIAAGVIAHCGDGPTVFSDPVSITGTSGDSFYAEQW